MTMTEQSMSQAQYARDVQLANGSTLQARDIRTGDVIALRCTGSSDLTPHTVSFARYVSGGIVSIALHCVCRHHEASATMPIRVLSAS